MKHEIDLSCYQVRTDLISEIIANTTSKNGYTKTEEKVEDILIETIIVNKEGSTQLHKKPGIYKTIYFEDITDEINFQVTLKAVIKVMNDMILAEKIPKAAKCLVVGLGNRKATPDALGPLVSEQLVVTSHLFQLGIAVDSKYRSVETFAPGVMGTTGMETKDVILGIFKQTNPDFLIVIDALAASHLERLNKTIQITNTGIHPGSGVGNHRAEISKDTLGVPVIALGIPTVVDAVTIVSNTIHYLFDHISYEKDNLDKSSLKFVSHLQRDYREHEEHLSGEEKEQIMGLVGLLDDEQMRSLIAEVLMPLGYNLIVTPKEVDFMIEKLSKLIAEALNKSLHGNEKDK